jgi:hypothetical protein
LEEISQLDHQYFGEQKYEISFTSTTALTGLAVGKTITAQGTGGTGTIIEINFTAGSTTSGKLIINNVIGAISSGDTYDYDDSGTTRSFIGLETISLRPEGEVIKHVTTNQSINVVRIEADSNYPDGLVFVLDEYHDFEDNQWLDIIGLPNTGTWADLNRFNGRQRISKRIETTDGFSNSFVIYKTSPTDIVSLNGGGSNIFSTTNVTVISSDNYAILTLLNSPNKFELASENSFRFQDAVDLIQRNKEFIAEEALELTKTQYPSLVIPDESKCLRDIKHIIDAVSHDLFYGGNAATEEAGKAYFVSGNLSHINNQLTESIYAFNKARDLCILAARNWNTGTGAYSEPRLCASTFNNTVI